ncbi:MAG: alpha/beta hydrolase family protein, partial [Terriglobales bacterium]
PYTVRQGYIEDARAAVATLARDPKIDPRRIFLAGHSMGGHLAPRIASHDPRIAGIAILDGQSRRLFPVMEQQLQYMAALAPPSQRPALLRDVALLRSDARRVADAHLAPSALVLVPPGVKVDAAYFQDLRDHSPTAIAARLKIPILVIQGSRDYQVRMADFRGWQKALRGRANARCILIPGTNHLLMPGPPGAKGLSTPADYARPNHVSPRIIEVLAGWVHSHR